MYVAQYFWAVLGIFLLYAIICVWRQKLVLWPLFILIFFSGADIIGSLITADTPVHLFGTAHLERWPGSYQFSSMTTQLFWVFNQAVPAWLACTLVFLYEKPRNMIFIWSLIVLTSTFPFVGLLPYIIYFMIYRSRCKQSKVVPNLPKYTWRNWTSPQNIIGGSSILILSSLYLLGNISGNMQHIISLLNARNVITIFISFLLVILFLGIMIKIIQSGYAKRLIHIFSFLSLILAIVLGIYWGSQNLLWVELRKLLVLLIFYILEIGIYFFVIRNKVQDRMLFWITVFWLLFIPLIKVGSSIDFCMRASIPSLLLVILWCIDIVEQRRKDWVTYALIILLILGSITPLHEITRTIANTCKPYTLENVGCEVILTSDNFSGSTYTLFWKYIAK